MKNKKTFFLTSLVFVIVILFIIQIVLFQRSEKVPSREEIIKKEEFLLQDFMNHQSDSIRNLANIPINNISTDQLILKDELEYSTIIELDLNTSDFQNDINNVQNYGRQQFLTKKIPFSRQENEEQKEGVTYTEFNKYLDKSIKDIIYNGNFSKDLDYLINTYTSGYWYENGLIQFNNLIENEYEGIEPPELDSSITFQLNDTSIKNIDYFKKLENYESASRQFYPLYENVPLINLFNSLKIIKKIDTQDYAIMKIGSSTNLKDFEQKNKIDVPIIDKTELEDKINNGNIFSLNEIQIVDSSSQLVFKEAILGYFLLLNEDTSYLVPTYLIHATYDGANIDFYTSAISYKDLLFDNLIYSNNSPTAYISPIAISSVEITPDEQYKIKGYYSKNDLFIKNGYIQKTIEPSNKRIVFIFPEISDEKYNLNEKISNDINETIQLNEDDGTFEFLINKKNFWQIYNAEKIQNEARSELDNHFQLIYCTSYYEIENQEFCSNKSINMILPLYATFSIDTELTSPIENKNESLDKGKVREIQD